jgi:hypothetical protein
MGRIRFEQEMLDLGLSESVFTAPYSPGFEYDTGDFAAPSAAPALLKPVEMSPLRQTLYVNIPLGIGRAPNKVDKKTGAPTKDAKFFNVEPMSGIFIPKNFLPQQQLDLVLYLHGHKGASPGNDVSINGYWNSKIQHFALREEVNNSGRNVIFVAPTLGPLSQAGNLTSAKGFDSYLTKVLAALNEHYVRKNSLPKIEGFGKIILAAHSGGGSPMLRIAELKGSANAPKISECWGFDSVYGNVEKRWVDWAAAHREAKLFFYSFDTIGRSKTLEKLGRDRTLNNICVYEWSGKDFSDWEKSHPPLKKSNVGPHFWIPIVYLRERLQNLPCRTAQPSIAPSTKRPAPQPKPENTPVSVLDSGGAANAGYKLTTVTLFKDKIKVASAGSQEKKTYVVIKESPSIFLPEIVRRAQAEALRDKKNDLAVKLDPDRWFREFTRITFLGRPLKDGQYLHLEMAKRLKLVEAELMKIVGSSDAKKTGDILLKNSTEGLSGSRRTSSTATFSMHMFGLAVDVNYLGNPYIESQNDITGVNNVLKNDEHRTAHVPQAREGQIRRPL